MGFSRKSNCDDCGHPLHLQDLVSSKWIEESQEFCFICSSCNKENIVVSSVFDKNGHIRRSYLVILKDDKEYIPSDLLIKVHEHLEKCDICKGKFNEEFFIEVEEKIRFNERSYNYFLKNSQEIKQDVENVDFEFYEDGNIKSFIYKDEKFEINKEDEFFRTEKDKIQDVCYYLRKGCCLTGMVCFSYGKKTNIKRIWFRSNEIIKKEQKFFQDLKEGKIKLKLDTIRKIFQTLHN